MPAYVEGAALVEGVAAHVLAELLATPAARRYLRARPPSLQGAIEEAVTAIRQAACAYEAVLAPTSGSGSAETPLAEIVRRFGEEITTGQAAVLLGVSERRARQLAAGGMGRKAGRTWLLDRAAVEEHRRRLR